MSYNIHEITQAVDSASIQYYDKTNPADYAADGIDPNNGLSSLAVSFTDYDMNEFYYELTTAEWVQSMTDEGLSIPSESFTISKFLDGVYKYKSTVTKPNLDEVIYIDTQVFYAEVKNAVMKLAIRAGWKKSFSSNKVLTRNEIRLQNWLRNLEYASELNLESEAKRLIDALQKLTGLWKS